MRWPHRLATHALDAVFIAAPPTDRWPRLTPAEDRDRRAARDGEPFTATTDCPDCGAVAVHWLEQPRQDPVYDDTPASRVLRMADEISDSLAAAAGVHSIHRDSEVVRVCVRCGHRWGQR